MGFIQRDGAVPTATLLSHARLGMVHQNLPHRSRGNREEMGTALKCPVLLTHHFQIGFVDEDRRLKGIARLLLAPHPPGDSMQLGVDHRGELFQGMRFALLQPGKHLGEVILRGHRFEYITDRYAGGNGSDGATQSAIRALGTTATSPSAGNRVHRCMMSGVFAEGYLYADSHSTR